MLHATANAACRPSACVVARKPTRGAHGAPRRGRAGRPADAGRPQRRVAALPGRAFAPGTGGEMDRQAALGNPVLQYDYLVIGSGIAGLSYALKVAEYGRVAIITKDQANEGCTQYAQGGVCAVLDATDSVEAHVEDTMVAGAFLNDPKAVDVVCREGPARVLDLVALGAAFTRNPDGTLHLTREGGHSNRRIVHAADLTGAEVERALLATARAHPAITFHEHHLAVDLVVDQVAGTPHCFGVDVLDTRANAMARFVGLSTMLASGGAGQVYPSTTNPHVATGDGMAMAYRAGALVSNMEFVQFHPTALHSSKPPRAGAAASPGAPPPRTFLITEALRGEGARLFNLKGERFMAQYDRERMELAPRDVVARAIHDQMATHGAPHVWLDISHVPAADVLHHFPNIAARCAQDGVDITSDPIPVLPAQHYMCGGVAAGLLGETSIQGLYAAGEVACSGLHGANRLASNSLLEGLVFADRAAGPSVAHAEYAARHCGAALRHAAASADFRGPRGARQLSASSASWVAARRERLQALMWGAAGIVRTSRGLAAAQRELAAAVVDAATMHAAHGVAAPLVELMNLATVAELVVSCALQRRESRGLHYNADHPAPRASEARPSLISASFSSRYDLDSLLVSGAKGVAAVTVSKRAASKSGPGGAPSPSGGGGGSREVSVRSLPEE